MNTTIINTTNGNLALKTREPINVPYIVATKPAPGSKEIDLTFVQFAQRKRAATDYINHVSHIREMETTRKAERKTNIKAKIKEFCGCVVFTTLMSLGFFGVALIGLMF